jgi:hypothetical protein
MAFAVKWQIDYWGKNLSPGDVILSNSPGTLFKTQVYVFADTNQFAAEPISLI